MGDVIAFRREPKPDSVKARKKRKADRAAQTAAHDNGMPSDSAYAAPDPEPA